MALAGVGCGRTAAVTVAPSATSPGSATIVDGSSIAATVAAGPAMSCALRDGDVLCWGTSAGGDAGDVTAAARPRTIAGVQDAREVAVGDGFGCARTAKGEVLCWGQVPGFGNKTAPATVAVGVTDAIQISASGRYACALQRGNTVSCWSDAIDARVEQVRGLDHVKQVAAGGTTTAHGCALLDDGRVACWGGNAEGQLGDGSATDSARPVFVKGVSDATFVAVNGVTGCAATRGGDTWCWGRAPGAPEPDDRGGWPTAHDEHTGAIARVDALRGAKQVAITDAGACAVAADGVRCVGAARLAPGARGLVGATWMALGADHACARVRDAIECWGSNANGATGRAARTVVWPPEIVPALDDVADVAAERGGTCALRRDGRIACFGANAHAETFAGTHMAFPRGLQQSRWHGHTAWNEPEEDPAELVVLGRVADATSIALASTRLCAVDRAGAVTCLGAGEPASPGAASPRPRIEIRGATRVVGGSGMFCALLSAGGAACFTDDGGWQRKFGDAIDVTLEPADADDPCVVRKNGSVDCWSVAEFNEPTSPGHRVTGVTDVVQVAGGGAVVCGARRGGDVVCWDAPSMTVSDRYAPAIADAASVAVFDVGVCALSRTGAVTCRNARPNARGGALRGATNARPTDYAVPLPEAATKLVSGGDHLCAELRSGRVACWGENESGQSGIASQFQASPAVVLRVR